MNLDFLKPQLKIQGWKLAVYDKIGEGAFAFVYKVKMLSNADNELCEHQMYKLHFEKKASKKSNYYAVKKMICQTEEHEELARKEIRVINEIKHKNVIPLLGKEAKTNSNGFPEFLLLLPLCSSSLQSVIDSAGKGFPRFGFNDIKQMINLLLCCAEGLEAIHQAGYRHGDFKPSNVLLVSPSHAVITDFGSVSDINIVITNRNMAFKVQEDAAIYTTAPFRSPELFNTPSQCVIDGKADVWSLGCTIYNCMFGRSPFESTIEGLSVLAVMSGSYQIPRQSATFPEEYFDLVAKCLAVDLYDRITINSAVELLSIYARANQYTNYTSSREKESIVVDSSKLTAEDNSPANSQHTEKITPQEASTASHTVLEFETNFANFEGLQGVISEGRVVTKDDGNEEEFGDFATADVIDDLLGERPNLNSRRKLSNDQSADSSSDIDTTTSKDIPGRDVEKYDHEHQAHADDEFYRKMVATPLPILLKRLFSDLQTPGYIIKSTTVNILRNRGLFPKKLVKKTVNLILTQHYIIIRKTADYDSKIHAMVLLSSRMGLTCSDTLGPIGLNGLVVQGDAILEFYPAEDGGVPVRSYAGIGMGFGRNSNSSLTMCDDADNDRDVGNTDVNVNSIKASWTMEEFELSFDSKQLLNDWVDCVDKQLQHILTQF